MDSIEKRYADLRAEILEKDQKLEHAHAVIKDLKRTAQNTIMTDKAFIREFRCKPCIPNQRVPNAKIEAFPDLPCALKSDSVNLKSDFNAPI